MPVCEELTVCGKRQVSSQSQDASVSYRHVTSHPRTPWPQMAITYYSWKL